MSSPLPIFGTQNLHDDDGPVIDSLLVETDSPPNLKMATQPINVPAPIAITRPTRLLTGSLLMTSGSDPQLIINSDPNRVAFHIFAFWVNGGAGPGFNDYINLSDEQGPVSNAKVNISTMGIIRLRPPGILGASPYEFNGHTGPIYLSPANALSGPIELTWAAVTQ